MSQPTPQQLADLSVKAHAAAAKFFEKLAEIKKKKSGIILREVKKIEDKQIQNIRTQITNINE